MADQRYYIQSALTVSDPDKLQQESRPLIAIKDSFQRIIVTKTLARPWFDDNGIKHMGLYDFLLDENALKS